MNELLEIGQSFCIVVLLCDVILMQFMYRRLDKEIQKMKNENDQVNSVTNLKLNELEAEKEETRINTQRTIIAECAKFGLHPQGYLDKYGKEGISMPSSRVVNCTGDINFVSLKKELFGDKDNG